MKRLFVLIVLFFVFLFGLTVGGSYNKGASELFEETKNKFENEIKDPNNEYESYSLVPQDNFVNKSAKKAEDIIEKIIDKLFSFLS